MSGTANQIVSIWKDVECQIRRMQPRFRGELCRGKNRVLYRDALSLWVLVCIDQLRSAKEDFHDYSRWLYIIEQWDIQDLMLFLRDADSLLTSDPLITYDAFKQRLKESYPLTGATLAPVKPIFATWQSEQDYQAFAQLRTFFCFISRLSFQSRELEDEALSAYLADEANIKIDGFTSDEREVITSWYPRTPKLEFFFLENFHGKHGDGCTADAGSHLGEKYKSLGWDLPLRILHKREFPGEMYPRPPVKFDRVSRLAFVPKSALSYRSISMEPATLMWHQQGFLSAWVRDLERRNHALRRRFHPSFQEPNREMAYEGSLDGRYSTIDLSSASDSVSWELVKTWFGDSCLYRWMCLTRSYATKLPDERDLPLRKFAPMGSALCFPTECMVFAAITECAIKELGGNPQASRYRVYGDDIVVETEYVQAVISRLERNGFRVNKRKTFTSLEAPFFRESCGGDYLDGFDVTPLRLSRWFSGFTSKVLRPGQASALVQLANDSYYRAPSVRRRIVDVLKTKTAIPFDRSGEAGIFSPNPTNFHLKREYHEEWMKVVMRVDRISPLSSKRDPAQEDIRLFEYLRRTDGRAALQIPEDTCSVRLAPPKSLVWSTTWAVPDDYM